MKIKIVSDGTARGTFVETETGERVDNVTAVLWGCSVGQISWAEIRVRDVPVNLVAIEAATKALRESETGV